MNNKMRNYFVKDSYSYMKKELIIDVDDFPIMLNIEPTLACNLNCFFCPSHSKELKYLQSREVGFMDFELYRKIIDECANWQKVLVLNLHKDGESSLHPQFTDMVRYAKEKKASKIIHFNTNALMSKEKAKEIILSGIDDITLSIDATNKEMYKKIKGVDKFDEVVSIAKYFFKKRDEYNKEVFIRVKMVVTDFTLPYKDEFYNQWHKIADEVQFQHIHNSVGALNIAQKAIGKRYACIFPFYSFSINWNGEVTLCHRDFNENDTMGNINESSIYEIYNSEKYNLYRKKLVENDLDGMMCKGCDSWRSGLNLDKELRKKYEI